MTELKVGDLVVYKAKFLKSVGWYTDVPKNGKVVETDDTFPLIHWCDREEAIRVHVANVILSTKRHTELF